MSTDFKREVSDALHRAADHLVPPSMDLAAIRRAGRRRCCARSTTLTALTAIIAAGAVTGGLRLAATPRHATGPHASPRPSYSSSTTTRAPTVPVATAAMTNVRAFYGEYAAASGKGRAAVAALIRERVASWYIPILEAPGVPVLDAVECGHSSDAAGLYYQQVSAVAGRSVIVVGSRLGPSANPGLSIVIADQATGKITGISCALTGAEPSVTILGAQDAARSLYGLYIQLRRQGFSMQRALNWLVSTGSTTGSSYLLQAARATASGSLGYDPVVCTPVGLPDVTVGRASVIAGGSAGLVTIIARRGKPILAVVVLGAKGWTVTGIACPQP
jgi:hypothetical protein